MEGYQCKSEYTSPQMCHFFWSQNVATVCETCAGICIHLNINCCSGKFEGIFLPERQWGACGGSGSIFNFRVCFLSGPELVNCFKQVLLLRLMIILLLTTGQNKKANFTQWRNKLKGMIFYLYLISVKVWSCLVVTGQTHVAGHRRGAAVAQSGVVWAEQRHQF